MRQFSSTAAHCCAVVGGALRRREPPTSPYSHAPTGSEGRIYISWSMNLTLFSSLPHQSDTCCPSAAKLASAAASSPHATPHSASVTAAVTMRCRTFRVPVRSCRWVRSAAKTVRARRKKFPNGRRTNPASASSGARLPLCPCASIPHRASTYQTANRCHTIHCQSPSGPGW